MKYSDTKSAGRSDVVPFRQVEGFKRRHSRRLNENLAFQSVLEKWCSDRGLTLSVKNDGHHWIIQGPRFLVEWWPSSAKLVFEKRWNQGVHCHDVEQLATLVAKRFEGKP